MKSCLFSITRYHFYIIFNTFLIQIFTKSKLAEAVRVWFDSDLFFLVNISKFLLLLNVSSPILEISLN
jgi:hypothetical protein